MKVWILNDSDPWIARKLDIRSWAARGLWFAQPGDVVVSIDPLDPGFVDHVVGTKGMSALDLTLLSIGANAYDGTMFDGLALASEDFVRIFAAEVDVAAIDGIEAMWTTAGVARFAERIGRPDALPGVGFFAQNGYELSNSKGNFRALASAIGVPLPVGWLARSAREAVEYTGDLLAIGREVMAKRTHGAGGGGNHLIAMAGSRVDPLSSGATRCTTLADGSQREIEDFWAEHWEWMSYQERYPVVLEAFEPDCATYYCEFTVTDDGVGQARTGALLFRDGGLATEVHPCHPEVPEVEQNLVAHACRIAEAYRSLGYRGHLSADAVVTPDGRVVFTEVNGRYTGSTHLYEVMAGLPSNARASTRVCLQTESDPGTGWDLGGFLTVLETHGLNYRADRAEGIVAVCPPLGPPGGGGPVMFDVVAADRARCDALLQTYRAAESRRVDGS